MKITCLCRQIMYPGGKYEKCCTAEILNIEKIARLMRNRLLGIFRSRTQMRAIFVMNGAVN